MFHILNDFLGWDQADGRRFDSQARVNWSYVYCSDRLNSFTTNQLGMGNTFGLFCTLQFVPDHEKGNEPIPTLLFRNPIENFYFSEWTGTIIGNAVGWKTSMIHYLFIDTIDELILVFNLIAHVNRHISQVTHHAIHLHYILVHFVFACIVCYSL